MLDGVTRTPARGGCILAERRASWRGDLHHLSGVVHILVEWRTLPGAERPLRWRSVHPGSAYPEWSRAQARHNAAFLNGSARSTYTPNGTCGHILGVVLGMNSMESAVLT